jgi:hypothetical protein
MNLIVCHLVGVFGNCPTRDTNESESEDYPDESETDDESDESESDDE